MQLGLRPDRFDAARTGIWRALVLVTMLVVACGDGNGVEDEVLDFSQIAEEGPDIESDTSGSFATLRVTTTIDAVCAVAFGETEELGMLATDQEMGAAGHSDHEVALGGLSPDTEYFYRLQGVGVDGRLYRSDLFSFRTPSPAGSAGGENVAVGAEVVEVSSEFSSAFSAANAVDGNVATEWSSAGDGDDAFLVVDLGREVEAISVGFHTRSMSGGSARTETFTVTVDDSETFGPFPVGRAESSFTGRVVRFDVETSTGGNTGALEVEVIAAGSQ